MPVPVGYIAALDGEIVVACNPLLASPARRDARMSRQRSSSMLVPMMFQLSITLAGIEPPIWRRVLVPSDFTLYDLHFVIQTVMGWENCHLHDFKIKRKRYAVPDLQDYDAPEDETTTRLQDVVRPRSKFVYLYDYGDSWTHDIVIEKAVDDVANELPICVDGTRACAPEDSGGAWGYADKLETLADPDNDDDAELREWLGENFDPEAFDLNAINRDLQTAFRPSKQPAKRNKRRK